MTIAKTVFVLTAISFLVAGGALAGAAPTMVVVDFSLQDDMQPAPGVPAPGAGAVARRVQALTEHVTDRARASTRYRLLPLDRESAAYARLQASSGRLFQCRHCLIEFGEALGVDYVLHGWVQRVSNLIINFNIEILGVDSGRVHDRAGIDIRGNTDKSWRDGADYLLRHMETGL